MGYRAISAELERASHVDELGRPICFGFAFGLPNDARYLEVVKAGRGGRQDMVKLLEAGPPRILRRQQANARNGDVVLYFRDGHNHRRNRPDLKVFLRPTAASAEGSGMGQTTPILLRRPEGIPQSGCHEAL